MAELFGLSLTQHLDNIFNEAASGSIYGFPLDKLYVPNADTDVSVSFQGKRAATPLGPASGPHTQMVQNILLSFLGGSRIMELKTVQILDELEIPRPCIDARTVGYNVEWSQELKLEDSYHEYVTAWMVLKIIEESEVLGPKKGDPFYDVVFDMSVGYDLKGISSPQVSGWIRKVINAADAISQRLSQLPERYSRFRNLEIDPVISNTLTLSTFHGCPRDEIQGIVEYLVDELGLDVLVKMNPTQLGYEFVRKTLNEDLGYAHIELDGHAFQADLQFEEGVAMMKRLVRFARDRNRRVGAKFTNTLVVKNADSFFAEKEMYLSGTPLHVLSMNAMRNFRRALGSQLPVSFSAGIDATNFVDAVCCGMKPVTTCTDLLHKGGYTRQLNYLRNLEKALLKQGCQTIDELILAQAGATGNVAEAALTNVERVVPALVKNPKYHHARNHKPPKKVGSMLEFFDCLNCNICLPVCPNGANISLPVGKQSLEMNHYQWQNDQLVASRNERLQLEKSAQIANLADFCNECANCEVFCPEDGGPQLLKPRFFSSQQTYAEFDDYDGFYLGENGTLTGRMDGVEYVLARESQTGNYRFQTPTAKMVLNQQDVMVSAQADTMTEGAELNMTPYYRMKLLYQGLQASKDYAHTLLQGHQEE